MLFGRYTLQVCVAFSSLQKQNFKTEAITFEVLFNLTETWLNLIQVQKKAKSQLYK